MENGLIGGVYEQQAIRPAVGVAARRGGVGLELGSIAIGLLEADGGEGVQQPAGDIVEACVDRQPVAGGGEL